MAIQDGTITVISVSKSLDLFDGDDYVRYHINDESSVQEFQTMLCYVTETNTAEAALYKLEKQQQKLYLDAKDFSPTNVYYKFIDYLETSIVNPNIKVSIVLNTPFITPHGPIVTSDVVTSSSGSDDPQVPERWRKLGATPCGNYRFDFNKRLLSIITQEFTNLLKGFSTFLISICNPATFKDPKFKYARLSNSFTDEDLESFVSMKNETPIPDVDLLYAFYMRFLINLGILTLHNGKVKFTNGLALDIFLKMVHTMLP